MGRIIVSNNEKWRESLKALFSKTELDISYENDVAVCYKKLCVDNENYVSYGDNWIISNGTLIYSGSIGKEALSKLYDEFDGDINKCRSKCLGSYFICIKKNNKIFLFVDPYATYSIYYYIGDDGFLFSNMYMHIQHCVKQKFDQDAFLELTTTFCILSNETIFNNIYRLRGNECVVVDKTICINEVESQDESFSFTSSGKMLDTLIARINEITTVQKRLFGSKAIFITGGLDSRFVAAATSSVGMDASFHYFGGDTSLENYNQPDEKIGREIADTIGGKYTYHDISHDFISDYEKINENDLALRGEYTNLYGGSPRLVEMFRNDIDAPCDEYGYFGEFLNSWEQLDEEYNRPFSLKDFINRIYMNRHNHTEEKNDAVERRIYNGFLYYIKRNNMNEKDLSKSDCCKLYSFYRLRADVIMCNFSNVFRYNYILLGQPDIFPIIRNIPYEWKKGPQISLMLTDNLYSKLLSIPIFSHGKWRVIDENYCYTKNTMLTIKDMIRAILVKIMGTKGYGVFSYIRHKARKLVIDDKTNSLMKDWKIIDYCKEEYKRIGMIDLVWKDTSECHAALVAEPLIMLKLVSDYLIDDRAKG
ncbi:hypothetical protein [Butyrivibrio sp. INlla21]|uniref:hypothetical protein n=1 Tax=Butyrivibrio sp. INlla21 TaxID=1520811 RepID=UPI0008DF77A4|nr:hypothetical protein [Butyrivibrio sp. INlla21]SFV02743.1 hypothetical protein SAMN02910342_03061 [Butyrivibrio sp. INlla21]